MLWLCLTALQILTDPYGGLQVSSGPEMHVYAYTGPEADVIHTYRHMATRDQTTCIYIS